MNIQIQTTQFEFAHGKKPRGRGFWMFIVKHIKQGEIREEIMSGENASQTFREACSSIKNQVDSKIINCEWNVHSIQVAP